jgi:hypothetical protein
MTPPQSGPGSLPRRAEDIGALMQRLQPFEGRFSSSDSASQAAFMLANNVSPPVFGTSRA